MDDTTGRMTPHDAQDETDLRTQEIREEIAQTRVEMSETIEAIQERLTPSNLVAQAGETVRNATTEKVKQMANTAGNAAEQVMDTSFAQTIRANPIPAAMIGIGAAWMLIKGRSDADRRYRGRDDSRYRARGSYDSGGAYGTGGSYGATGRDWQTGAPADVAVGTRGLGTTGSGTSGVGTAGYGAPGYGDYGTGMSGDSARVPEFGGDMAAYYGGARQASVNFERVIRDNPLVVGAAAALVGVAIGLSFPASETENRLMGEARDNVVDRARGLASEAAEKVQDVAGQAAEAATQVGDAAKRATNTIGQTGSAESTGTSSASESTGSIGTSRMPRSTTRRNTPG